MISSKKKYITTYAKTSICAILCYNNSKINNMINIMVLPWRLLLLDPLLPAGTVERMQPTATETDD